MKTEVSWIASCCIFNSYVNVTVTQHKEGYLRGGDKIDVVVFLTRYYKHVYATCFGLYLGHRQANSIKHKLSYFNLVALIWIHFMRFL